MGFVEAVKTCFRKCFTFSGRASRAEFLYFCLFLFLLHSMIAFVANPLNVWIFQANSLLQLTSLFPTISVFVRRLHDLNYRGWWALIGFSSIFISFVALAAVVAGAGGGWTAEYGKALSFLLLTSFLIFLFWLFFLSLCKGTEGDNRFGPDPLGKVL